MEAETKIKCNVSNTQYDLVKQVLAQIFGCELIEEENEQDCELFWQDNSLPPEKFSKMKIFQKINHFPGMYTISNKNWLAWNLQKLQKLLPTEFNFSPKTWVLPADLQNLKSQFNNNRIFIVKPEALSQGKGIFLTTKLKDLNFSQRTVVQQYLTHPFLLQGLKFDLRIYVLITSCQPLRVFIHQDGLTRFATQQYTPPSPDNLDNPWMHLTNYAINKLSSKFVFNADAEQTNTGHKRTLKSTYDSLEAQGHDLERLLEEIDEIVIKTILAGQQSISYTYKSSQPDDYTRSMCFQILGFDIMLDSSLKPWLLEVNHSPSFIADTPLDYKIKEKVISDTVQILNIKGRKRFPLKKNRNNQYYNQVFQRVQKEKSEWEDNHLGGFRRIYPVNRLKYQVVQQHTQQVWSDWIRIKQPKPKEKPKQAPKPEFVKPRIQAKSRYRTAPAIVTKKQPINLPPVGPKKILALPEVKILFNLDSEIEDAKIQGHGKEKKTETGKEQVSTRSRAGKQPVQMEDLALGLQIVQVGIGLKPRLRKPSADAVSGKMLKFRKLNGLE